ncbi:hypothetical protein LY90DRAFT_700431 [Neocallimastix californiae]|uniref:UBZ4-type domain-containing protein n=1 Tax=Neocallimastix californiae TaxID=1754190 RepID=A0A1Y2E8X0_9FUNG|nr:hypothetical protein LY90DRAFT_700431 [Neocallimastix californiae]|eukprot:ORY68001.1 hypothetical protein LY90DRAFT_700431 [Neocallimastix californiae]
MPPQEKLTKSNSLSSLSEIKTCPLCGIKFINKSINDINEHINKCAIIAFNTDDI